MNFTFSAPEKSSLLYFDDENHLPEPISEVPYSHHMRTRRSYLPSKKTTFLVIIIVALMVWRATEGFLRAPRSKHRNNHAQKQPVVLSNEHMHLNSDGAIPPLVELAEPTGFDSSKTLGLEQMHETKGTERVSRVESMGLTIAASADVDGNRQIYDMDSDGVVRVRRADWWSSDYTAPEEVPIWDVEPGSPLAPVAWKLSDGKLMYLLIYGHGWSQSLSQIRGYSDNATAPITWRRPLLFGRAKTVASFSAIGTTPFYDTDPISYFVYYVSKTNGTIRCIYQKGGAWYDEDTTFTAMPGSEISVNAARDRSGRVTNLSVIYTDSKKGLVEIRNDPLNKPGQYVTGRIVDPGFPVSSPPHFASTYSWNPQVTRIYCLDTDSVSERSAASSATSFSRTWSDLVSSDDYSPETPGGSVSVVSWRAGAEVRVYYKATNAPDKIAVIGMGDQVPVEGWAGLGFID